jgi:hypothetical protein
VNRSAVAWLVVASVLVGATVHGGALAVALVDGPFPTPWSASTPSGTTPQGDERTDVDAWEPLVQYEDPDLGLVDSYWVDEAGELEPRPVHGSIEDLVWEVFLRVTSAPFASKVVIEYLVGDAPNSDTLAYVAKGEDHEYWSLAVNLDVAEYPDLLVPTLVHEYAHLLSLARGELDPAATANTCTTVHVWEGCLRQTSMLWAFQERFWEGAVGAPGPENDDWELADAYYVEHEDDFVSDYAAMNVVEDFAESFMVYVMEEVSLTGTIADGSIASAKVAFFAEYPELVAIRDRIRAEFAAELGFAP